LLRPAACYEVGEGSEVTGPPGSDSFRRTNVQVQMRGRVRLHRGARLTEQIHARSRASSQRGPLDRAPARMMVGQRVGRARPARRGFDPLT
jgi:hypothetical protein